MASSDRYAARYRLTLDSIVSDYVQLIEQLIIALFKPDDRENSLKKISPLATDITRKHRNRAWNAGVDLLESSAIDAGVYDPFIPQQPGYPEQSVETTLRKHLRGTPREAAKRVAAHLSVHVEDAGRSVAREAVEQEQFVTVKYNGDDIDWDAWAEGVDDDEDDEPATQDATRKEIILGKVLRHQDLHKGKRPFAYARVLSGAENCAFCIMLASRGPVYKSAKTAGARNVSTAFATAGVTEYVNSYHPNCDCLVVPVYSSKNWIGKEQQEFALKLYNQAVSTEWVDEDGIRHDHISYNHGPHKGKGNQVILEMAKILRQMKARGEKIPAIDIRSLENGRLTAGRR